MHELGLMETALQTALSEACRVGAERIDRLTLRVGAAAGADSDVLRMGFAAMTRGTIAAGAQLEIEMIPVRVCCPNCQFEFEPEHADEIYFECPHCHSFTTSVIQGKDIGLGLVEVE